MAAFPITQILNGLHFVMQDENGCLFRATPEMISKYICSICENNEGITPTKSCFTYNNLNSCPTFGEIYAHRINGNSQLPIQINDIHQLIISKTNSLNLSIEEWIEAGNTYPLMWYIYNPLDQNTFAIVEVVSATDIPECSNSSLVTIDIKVANGFFVNGNNLCAYVFTNSLDVLNIGGGVPIYKGVNDNIHEFRTLSTNTPTFIALSIENDKVVIDLQTTDLANAIVKNIYNTDGTLTGSRTVNGDNKALNIYDLAFFNLKSKSFNYYEARGQASTWGIGNSTFYQDVNGFLLQYYNDAWTHWIRSDLFAIYYHAHDNSSQTEIKQTHFEVTFEGRFRYVLAKNLTNKLELTHKQWVINREIGQARMWTHPLDPNANFYKKIPEGWVIIIDENDTTDYFGLYGINAVEEGSLVTCRDEVGNPIQLIVPKVSGVVHAGFKTEDSLFNIVGGTIGEKTEDITINNIPEHDHFILNNDDLSGGVLPNSNNYIVRRIRNGDNSNNYTLIASDNQPTIGKTSKAGGSEEPEPLNIIQPTHIVRFIFCVGIN